MDQPGSKPTRGRPKTFDRAHVIDVAMRAYWEDGQAEVSLNDVCRRAKVSKPTLYKEFGNEDGLKQAVLVDYHKMTLAPLFEMLAKDQPLDTALSAFADYILRDHQDLGMPNGCLLVNMCQCREHLGDLAGAQVDQFQNLSLSVFEAWVDKAKAKGQLKPSISARTAAIYIDAQIASIMNLQRQGTPAKDLNAVFRLALSVFE